MCWDASVTQGRLSIALLQSSAGSERSGKDEAKQTTAVEGEPRKKKDRDRERDEERGGVVKRRMKV